MPGASMTPVISALLLRVAPGRAPPPRRRNRHLCWSLRDCRPCAQCPGPGLGVPRRGARRRDSACTCGFKVLARPGHFDAKRWGRPAKLGPGPSRAGACSRSTELHAPGRAVAMLAALPAAAIGIRPEPGGFLQGQERRSLDRLQRRRRLRPLCADDRPASRQAHSRATRRSSRGTWRAPAACGSPTGSIPPRPRTAP